MQNLIIKKFAFPRLICLFLYSLISCITLSVQAQNAWRRAANHIDYKVESSVQLSSDITPFWHTANKYGLSGIRETWGYLEAGISRQTESDSAYNWKIGYGLSLAASYNMTSAFSVQELFADIQWKRVRLSVGSKKRGSELKNPLLSTGGLTCGINARPIPQVRFELPEFWTIPKTKGWLAIRGHIAYGCFTDASWNEDFHAPKSLYSAGSLYHSKAGFLRIGNQQKFPLSFTGGLEMNTQFGGEAWNVGHRADDNSGFTGAYIDLPENLSSFWHAFIPGGDDGDRDGAYKNVEGNHLGSWHFSLDYNAKNWGLRAYVEHFFEDHSQMFLEYGWKDLLFGIETNLPKNPIISTLLYEYISTTDQTGGIYHDATSTIPEQISGADNYYNHMIYGAWQHWGNTIGNPLLISPIYNKNGQITVFHNRIKAHHVGIMGTPTEEVSYRLLYTHHKSLGTYLKPTTDPLRANYFMAEVGYKPKWGRGISLTASLAGNTGDILGNSLGGLFTLRWNGNINKQISK